MELNYLEKLQLISLIDENLFTEQNKLYCILKQLYENKKLTFNKGEFNFKRYGEKELSTPYEEKFLDLYMQRRHNDLFDFLFNLKLSKSFELKGLIKLHFKKSKFNLFNKYVIEKTDLFYTTYNNLVDKSKNEDLTRFILGIKEDELSKNLQLLVSKILKNRN